VSEYDGVLTGRLRGELFEECAGWIWEQLQDDGVYLAGELIELILVTERELGLQDRPLPDIARALGAEFGSRGLAAGPGAVDERVILPVLEWEDDFLGFAGIPRAES
jgi:hypothetical protein